MQENKHNLSSFELIDGLRGVEWASAFGGKVKLLKRLKLKQCHTKGFDNRGAKPALAE